MLTEQERDAMAHAIGHHSAKGCSVHGGRNHYVTDADDTMWRSLVERGLAKAGRPTPLLPEGEICFHLTDKGITAVESDPRSKRSKRTCRLYTVRFRGFTRGVSVYAESHSKAKYQAVLDVLDAMSCSAREAFREITSCRLGSW